MGMVVPGPGVLLELLPAIEAHKILPIEPMQAIGVRVGPVEIPSEFAGKDDIGVEMQDPIVPTDLIQAAVDKSTFVESAPVTLVIVADDAMDRMPPTYRLSLLIIATRDDHDPINQGEILGQRVCKEVGISNAYCYALDLHGKNRFRIAHNT
jgi:hypothetical protein